MKNVIKVFLITVCAITLGVGLSFIIDNHYASKTYGNNPYSWIKEGYFVEDNKYDGGKYYHVNDSLRIVFIDNQKCKYQQFRLFVLINNEYYYSGIFTYKSTHDNFSDMLMYLKYRYNNRMNKSKNFGYEY